MIEINLQKLQRGLRAEMRTVRRGGKVYQRKQRVGRKEVDRTEPTSFKMDTLAHLKPRAEGGIAFIEWYGWNTKESTFYDNFISPESYLFMKDDKIHAISDFSIDKENVLKVNYLEVNSNMQRQGHGVGVMKEIVHHAVDNNVEKIVLESMDENSNKFYTALGLEEKEKIIFTRFEGGKKWMKSFLKAK